MTFGTNSPRSLGPKVWNNLTNEVESSETIHIFTYSNDAIDKAMVWHSVMCADLKSLETYDSGTGPRGGGVLWNVLVFSEMCSIIIFANSQSGKIFLLVCYSN